MEEKEFDIRILGLRDKMFRFARSILLQPDQAEDVVHDTLEKLWIGRAKLSECRNVEAFVMTAVRNGCYDRLRRRKIFRQDDTSCRSVEPDTVRREVSEVVMLAMTSLPDKQREVLYFKEIEGYEMRQIATMMHIEENQVRAILSRARKGLRQAVEILDNETENRRY